MAAGCRCPHRWCVTALILGRPRHCQLSETRFVLGAEDLYCNRLDGFVEGCHDGSRHGTKVQASEVERHYVVQGSVSEHLMALAVGAEVLLWPAKIALARSVIFPAQAEEEEPEEAHRYVVALVLAWVLALVGRSREVLLQIYLVVSEKSRQCSISNHPGFSANNPLTAFQLERLGKGHRKSTHVISPVR